MALTRVLGSTLIRGYDFMFLNFRKNAISTQARILRRQKPAVKGAWCIVIRECQMYSINNNY